MQPDMKKYQEKIRMRAAKLGFCLLAVILLGAAVLPGVGADNSNKKTVVTFDQAVEVPGTTLPAGTYTFQLMESAGERHIVEIFNSDGSHLITTVLAINDYRLEPTGKNVMKFSERPADSPDALRAWFYPGDNFGQEFVYPKARAVQLAETTKVAVPALEADALDSAAMKTIPIVAVTPDQKEVEVSTVIETAPPAVAAAAAAPVEVAQVTETKQLPETASSLPLFTLFGVALVGLGLGLRRFSKLTV
jgi:LPXTG-motif cell wall-anchored protein